MVALRPLTTIVCIQDEPTRNRCLQFLRAMQAGGQLDFQLPRYRVEVKECTRPEEVPALLHAHFDASAANTAVLISDMLAETIGAYPQEGSWPTCWAKSEILDKFEDQLLGTIAVMDQQRRVPDIDRVLWQNFDAEALLHVFGLVADKLTYISPPERLPTPGGPVVVRPIKDKTELQNYFLLRHRVYRLMGYLEPWAESAFSGMEINSGDTHALHVGAFVKVGVGQQLVGTARVVSLEPLDNRYVEWTRSLARTDPVLKTKVHQYDQLRLPIFHSMKLNETMEKVLTEKQNCGELSRVIVTEDFRGKGISELLVWFAVLQAVNQGVSHLLLECLPIHERLYRKFGFVRMQGVTGRVLGVNKTMIAMELSQLAFEEVRKQPSIGRFLQKMREQGYLQSCQEKLCGKAECDHYMKGKCPS